MPVAPKVAIVFEHLCQCGVGPLGGPTSLRPVPPVFTKRIGKACNDTVTIPFVLDSGAGDVSIPEDVFKTLLRTRTITESDFLAPGTYIIADGSARSERRIILHELRVGSYAVTDIVASVAPDKADALLGQSFLGKLPGWAIDNAKHTLVIPVPSPEATAIVTEPAPPPPPPKPLVKRPPMPARHQEPPQPSQAYLPSPQPQLPPTQIPSAAVTAGYDAAVSAWLKSHKRYPYSARQRGDEGRAVLHFQIDRSGRVLDYAVVKSSGFPGRPGSPGGPPAGPPLSAGPLAPICGGASRYRSHTSPQRSWYRSHATL
jgi:hypothetical protein